MAKHTVHSPFSAAAERLDRIIQDVKAKQFDATGVKAIPVEEPSALHPEEAWARNFATHSFRPVVDKTARPPLSGFVTPPADMPRMPVFREAEVAPPARQEQGSGHIGSALGKPAPRRSLLGRLFRGRAV